MNDFKVTLKRTLKLLSFAGLLNLSGATLCFGALEAQILFDNEEKSVMEVGTSTNLKLDVFDSEALDPIHHFHPMHDKKMHLIMVSEDLESFAHLHPYQPREHLSIFELDLNQPTSDPDNQDAIKAVSKAGAYFLFAEFMPMGYSMTTLPLNFTAVDSLKTKPYLKPSLTQPLPLDPVDSNQIISKRVGYYEIKLKAQTYPHCGNYSALLEMELKYFDPVSHTYQEILDLQPWLSSFGHAIMISEQGQTAQEKTFVHLHAVWPLVDDPETERGPYLRLASDNHTPLTAGVFKIWVQFKHQNQVQTIPFVIEIKIPETTEPGLELKSSFDSKSNTHPNFNFFCL